MFVCFSLFFNMPGNKLPWNQSKQTWECLDDV